MAELATRISRGTPLTPQVAVLDAPPIEEYDERVLVMAPTCPTHIDLPARVSRLGLPVTVVTAGKAGRPLASTR